MSTKNSQNNEISVGVDINPKISIVVSVTNNLAIGSENDLLVRISDDLKRFKEITSGHTIIMGRKTYESIGKPLPNRTNIIVTRNKDFKADGCVIVNSIDEAFNKARDTEKEEIIVIGGGEIYKQSLPFTDKLYLTLVDSDVEGNIFFPDWRKDFTKETFKEERLDEKTGLKYTWLDLERT